MGRSSHGKSESFRPGSGKPLVGRRFSYDQVPEWDGLFGEQVQGEYGPRMREDKEFKPRINESILKIRESVREQVRNIKETSYQITDRTRQDYLDNAWVSTESNLTDLRNQFILYRHTPIEPVLNQAIKSEVYKLKQIESLYDQSWSNL